MLLSTANLKKKTNRFQLWIYPRVDFTTFEVIGIEFRLKYKI